MTTVGIKWCHNCAAWQVVYGVATALGDDNVDLETYDNIEFGPFDTIDDVLEAAIDALVRLVATPGRPWVS